MRAEPEKRERILSAIAENPGYVIESITRLLTSTTSPTTAPKPAPTQEEVREERKG
ncbi:MAG: hypothetical protein RXR43_13835 [Sulfolobus sp.]